jgi:hypothetical protein
LYLQIANKNRNNGKSLRTSGSKRKKSTQNRGRQANDLATVADSRIRRFTPMCYGFPDRLVSTLRYHSLTTLSSVSGSVAQYGFRWNSIFDPDYTSAGHQPLYRDTYAAIYDQYAVISARAKITFASQSTSTPAYISVVTDDDASPSSTGDTLAEMSHGISTLLGTSAGGRGVHEISTSWDCKKVLGIDPFASETYKTAQAANPSEQSYLWITNIATGGGTVDVLINVLMEFDVLFTELTTPTQS